HVRMNHARAEDFGPSALLADATSGAVAEQAGDIDFGARFGEREKTRAEAHAGIRPKERAQKLAEHALQMRHRDHPGAVHHKAFDLAEHRRGADAQFVATIAIAR